MMLLETWTESQTWRYATRKIGTYIVLTTWVKHWQIYRLVTNRDIATPVNNALDNYCLQRKIQRWI